MNEPTRLEFSESCGRSDSEAASTPRSDADNLAMHVGVIRNAFWRLPTGDDFMAIESFVDSAFIV